MPRRVLLIAADSNCYPFLASETLLAPEIVATPFKTVNYDFQWACCPIQGQHSAAYNQPSLILIAHQPAQGVDGLELCRQLKSSHLTNAIPVVIYSAENNLTVLNQAYSLGATFFLSLSKPHKPFEMAGELFDSCLRILDQRAMEGFRFLRQKSGTNGHAETIAINGSGLSHVFN